MSDTSHSRPTSAERMRALRERRAKALRVIPFEIRDAEVDALIRHGLLAQAGRDDRDAIAAALGRLLDRALR